MADILSSIFGGKPEVAPYTPTLLGPEQLMAIQNNISAFPDITQLGDLYQQYMMSAFDKAIPGFTDILAQGGVLTEEMMGQIEPMLKGQIPQDVAEQIQRTAAYQSLMGGFAGSPMGGALTARDLGMTSLNMIQQGAGLLGQAGNAAQRWAGLASGMIMSPSGMMITPQQQAQMDMQNRLYEQATKQLRHNIAAAPNPALQALNQWVEQVGGMAIGAAMGNVGGGKGGSYMTSWNPSEYSAGTGGATPNSPATMQPYNFGGVPTAGAVTPGVFNQYPDYTSQIAPNPFTGTTTFGISPYSTMGYDSSLQPLYGVGDFGLAGLGTGG